MPKIIKDVKLKILNTAHDLFTNNSYENVDIRKIGKECGIAVGTIYNYYSNKHQLFKAVAINSWNETLKKLNNVMISDMQIDNKIKSYIELFFDEISSKNGIGKQLFRLELVENNTEIFNHSYFSDINVRIELQLKELLTHKYGDLTKDIQEIDVFIRSLFLLLMRLDSNVDKDMKTKLIVDLIDGYMLKKSDEI